LPLSLDAAKINEETGDDLDDNVMFDDVDGEEDDIDDVSLSFSLLLICKQQLQNGYYCDNMLNSGYDFF